MKNAKLLFAPNKKNLLYMDSLLHKEYMIKKLKQIKFFFTTKKKKLSGMTHMDFRLNCYSLIFQNKSGDRLFFFKEKYLFRIKMRLLK